MNNKGKKLQEYMKLPYTIVLQRDEEGDFIARIKELEGCVADGQDEIEALGNLERVKELWIEMALKGGHDVPLPDSDQDLPSGKFLTRVPRSLHNKLIDLAKKEGVSLNQLVAVSLSRTVGERSQDAGTSHSVEAVVPQLHGGGAYGGSESAGPLRIVASNGVVAKEVDPTEVALSLRLAASRVPHDQKIARPQFRHYDDGGVAIGY